MPMIMDKKRDSKYNQETTLASIARIRGQKQQHNYAKNKLKNSNLEQKSCVVK